MDKYIGKKLEGRYEILELIGFGGMAVVFKARDILENRFVAIKILKDEYLQNDDFKRRFRNESKAIALLSHPSIVKIFDVNFSDNIQYIVMEYIDGITLKEYIDQQSVVKWKEAVHFTVQILRALQHAHDNGIVHRDIKPQNVMLLEDGTIKVMDFGIARFARENGKTLSDKAIGSVHYISPEQARGENTDEKTDIYSVGVIMYEMLTGKVPFDGDTPVSIAIKQMQMEPAMPSTINPDIPIGLEEITLRAMQKDPQLRYLTASEMLKDIDEFKHNPSVVFEYKYFNRDGTTKYFNKLDAHNNLVAAEKEEPKRSYVMNILAGVTAACVILACVVVYFFLKNIGNRTPDVILPSFLGMTYDQAKQQAPNVKIEIIDEEPSPDYEAGIIIKQEPGENVTVKANSVVNVTVSSGIEAIVMPDLVNETASIAKEKLTQKGLLVETVQKFDSMAIGNVINTDPPAGTELKKGDKVILYVSLGAADIPISVPNLIGSTEPEARSKLGNLKLSVGNVTFENSNQEKGTITWQSIEPETKVEKNTKIDIKISNGIPLNKKITIDIPFPPGADDNKFDFNIYINGIHCDTKRVNPSKESALKLEFELKDKTINGQVESTGTDYVTVIINDMTFAEYNLNFDEGSSTVVTQPNYDLIFSYGYDQND